MMLIRIKILEMAEEKWKNSVVDGNIFSSQRQEMPFKVLGRVCVFSANTMSSRFSHVVACIKISFLYKASIPLYVCYILFIHLPTDGHWGVCLALVLL